MKKIFLLLSLTILLSACGTKTTVNITPTPEPKLVELAPNERPLVSLIPRDDGHMLYLKMSKIPVSVAQIEYEVLYTATDGKSEIEKGVGDTIKEVQSTIDRNILLGTESCTNGCKYKYDEGVNGGTVTINFITSGGQIFTFESPFTLKSATQISKDGEIKLAVEDFSVKPKSKITGKDFFVLMKNYQGGYSIFSNGTSSLVGNY